MDFQQVVMRLNEFWADHGCLLWQPYNVQVGAGTMNPATVLRVMGPEPWNVAYLEPSVRPDDGRYGENPNRWSQFYQYQVILKPDPGNPLELYLESLRALGVDTAAHDVRFVEDNWESPALGAWGLGWEVWMDGQEITQFTYFQQAGGVNLEPVSVEITYGLERIVMVLQGVRGFNDIRWSGAVTYGDMHLRTEIENCTYNFEVAGVDSVRQMYDLCESEAKNALVHKLVIPAHDYVLKCSHLFNVLDARGAIGVTERARYFVRMRDLARQVTALYLAQREEMGYPLAGKFGQATAVSEPLPAPIQPSGTSSPDLVLEIGCEELPVADLDVALAQLEGALAKSLNDARLKYAELRTVGTPRRLVAIVRELDARQEDQERIVKGPPARVAYDDSGNPTKAALGFARGQGLDVTSLQKRVLDGKEYAVAVIMDHGRDASAVLSEILPGVVSSIRFPLSMRWNASAVNFSRPIRWLLALLGDQVVPLEFAQVRSGRTSRGIRPDNSPELTIAAAADYVRTITEAGILLSAAERQTSIREQAAYLANQVGGEIPEDAALLREVANLVEYPLAIRGSFGQEYLRLPDDVLLAVMRKHQRYLPIVRDGKLLPHFVAVANGKGLAVDQVRFGNEEVLRARYADAVFFYDADTNKPLHAFTPRLHTLTFQEELGSMLDKVHRIERLVPELGAMLEVSEKDVAVAQRAAALCKSDLATQLVVELTSLQGKMGRHYAMLSGESPEVAQAIEEHYLPRAMGDQLPESMPGVLVGIADRLDTLVGLFTVGIRPSGGADPWGLRRSALSLVQLLIGKGISLALPEAMSLAADLLPVPANQDALREVLDFVGKRYRGYLLDSGFRFDMVDAILAERGYDPYLAYRTLQDFVPWLQKEGWSELLDTFARCVRITRDQPVIYTYEAQYLPEPVAQALLRALESATERVKANPEIDGLFGALVALKPYIRSFFDELLVMAPEPEVRKSRLGLLQAIGALPNGIVDLTLMEGF